MSDQPAKVAMVPCRYKGPLTVRLRDHNGYDQLGNMRDTNLLAPGDVLMLPKAEAHGYSILHDKSGATQPQWVGFGKVWFDEHDQLDDHLRGLLGYEHHGARADFEPLDPAPSGPVPRPDAPAPDAQPKPEKALAKAKAASPASNGQLVGDESYIKPDPVVEMAPAIQEPAPAQAQES